MGISLTLFPAYFIYAQPIEMHVISEVANVRAQPIPHKGTYEHDILQETQVEKGDPVLVFEMSGKWARIECPDQPEFTHNERWQGYPGWILLSDLTKGPLDKTELLIPEQDSDLIRVNIVRKAAEHLGHPYLWGGRSLHNPTNASLTTGVDCSGLINWAYKEVGLKIPRDAHEQFMTSRPLNPIMLKPADLIFFAKKNAPHKIIHVAFYAGHGDLIEAPSTGEKVRQIAIKDRLQKHLSELSNGSQIGDSVVYFGSFFSEPNGK